MENLTKDEEKQLIQILEIAKAVIDGIYKVLKSPPGKGRVVLDVGKDGSVEVWQELEKLE